MVWLGLLVFALLVAFGTVANLPLYYLLPGYRQLLGITRVAYLVGTAGAVLGALGMDALMCSEGRTARAVTATTVTALALLVASLVGGMATWVFTGTLEARHARRSRAYTSCRSALHGPAARRVGADRPGPTQRCCAGVAGLALLVAIDPRVHAAFTPEQPTDDLEVRPAVIAALKPSPIRSASPRSGPTPEPAVAEHADAL